MSFKRFNSSQGQDYSADSAILAAGTLVVNSSNQLQLHDGTTAGGNTVVVGGTIVNANGIEMTTARGTVQFGYNLEAPGVLQHFHINKVDQSFDLFFGDDSNYLHLPAGGTAPIIGANDGTSGQKLWTFGQDGSLTAPGNIIPQANVSYTLGNVTNQWQSLYISSNTIYIGGQTLSVANGQLSLNGSMISGNYGDANVASYLSTHVPTGTYSNSNVASYLTTGISGNIKTTANVIAPNYLFANGVNILSTVGSGSGSIYSNVNVSALLTSFGSNSISTTGNITAGNLILGGQTVQLTGAVNPGYINVGLTTAINSIGAGSTFIYDAVLKNNGTAVTYNTSTGVFTLTAGVTYNLMATGSWGGFSDVTNGYLVYAWVDATTGTRLDTTGDSDGIAEPLNRPVNEFNATAAELIYTPVTNQTVKVSVVANVGTATMRGGIGSKAIVTQINPTVSLGAVATISATGSITAGGGLNVSGNIVGTQPNVTLIAGNYSTVFDNTGNVTLPTNGDLVMPGAGANLIVGGIATVNNTITAVGGTNATAFIAGNSAVGNVALAFMPTPGIAAQMSIRDYSTANSTMYFDTTIGSASVGGLFQFRGSNSYTQYAQIDRFGINLPTRPAFRVYGAGTTTALSTTQNTNGILNSNNWAVDFQQGTALSASTGLFTAPVAGLYQVNFTCRTNANNNNAFEQVQVRKNTGGTITSIICLEWPVNAGMNHTGGSTIVKLAVGDTLYVQVTGGTVNFDGNDNWSVAYIG
jgi:hypothetical protein